MEPQLCRICLDSTDESLVSPCAGCRGSSALVHLSCVIAFYRSRAAWWDLSCPTCKHAYEGRAAVDLGLIGLAETEKAHGPDHIEVAMMLTSLGNVYGHLGDAVQKRDLLERALAIKKREYGHDHHTVAITLTNLGNAHGDLGDAVQQRDLLEQALVINMQEYGPDHIEVAITLTNLGNAYGRLGDASRQRDLLQQALAIFEREHGPDHRTVAITLTNLGNAYGDLGDATRQRDLLERALAIKEREYGPDHIEVAITLTNLAHAHGALRDFPLAEAASARALRLGGAALPRPNALMAELSLNAVLVQRAAGHAERALELWAEANDELRRAVGEAIARGKLGAFTARATRFCTPDVAEWLASLAGAPEAADGGAKTEE